MFSGWSLHGELVHRVVVRGVVVHSPAGRRHHQVAGRPHRSAGHPRRYSRCRGSSN